jgi:hypothetical protein
MPSMRVVSAAVCVCIVTYTIFYNYPFTEYITDAIWPKPRPSIQERLIGAISTTVSYTNSHFSLICIGCSQHQPSLSVYIYEAVSSRFNRYVNDFAGYVLKQAVYASLSKVETKGIRTFSDLNIFDKIVSYFVRTNTTIFTSNNTAPCTDMVVRHTGTTFRQLIQLAFKSGIDSLLYVIEAIRNLTN